MTVEVSFKKQDENAYLHLSLGEWHRALAIHHVRLVNQCA